MKERDDELPLSGFIQLDDAYWGGVKKGKRGRGARNKSPFVAAVAMNEDGHPMKMRFSMVTGFRKGEIKDWASLHISEHSDHPFRDYTIADFAIIRSPIPRFSGHF